MSDRIPISFEQALTKYFGTIHELVKKPLPFYCQDCKRSYTEIEDKDKFGTLVEKLPIMSLSDIWTHIRKEHKDYVLKKNPAVAKAGD